MLNASHISKGMLTGAGSVVLKTCLNIILIPIIIQLLGLQAFSLYVIALSLLELGLIFDLGITAALIKLLTTEKRQILKAVGHTLYSGMALLVLGLGLLLVPMAQTLFHIPALLTDISRFTMTLVVAEIALTLYSFYYRAIALSHCKNEWVNLNETRFILISSLLGIGAIFSGYGLIGLFSGRVIASAIRTFQLIRFAGLLESQEPLFRFSLNIEALKCLLHQSAHSFMVNLSVLVSHKIDNLVIAFFLPLEMVGIYEIAFRFLAVITQIAQKVAEVAFPLFAQWIPIGNTEATKRLFIKISRINNALAGVGLILIVLFYPSLFELFASGKIPMDKTLPILAIAVPATWSGVLQMPAGYYLYTSGNERYLTISSLIAAGLNLLLSVILVQYWGIVGVALGTLLPQVIQHQVFLIRPVCKLMGISTLDYIKSVHLSNFLPFVGVSIYAGLVTIATAWQPLSGALLMMLGGFGVGIGVTMWLSLKESQAERKLILDKLEAAYIPLTQKWGRLTGGLSNG